MLHVFKKRILFLALSACAGILSACLGGGNSMSPKEPEPASLGLHMKIGTTNTHVNGTLGKGTAIILDQLIVLMTSSTGDTLRDTITTQGSRLSMNPVSITGSTQSPQLLAPEYSLRSLRTWTIVLKTLDANDSIIHLDTQIVAGLIPGETRELSLSLDSRFNTYQAAFSIPDSIGSLTGDTKMRLDIRRLQVVMDGTVLLDSTVSSGFFEASPTLHVLTFDYVLAGGHTVNIYAYGPRNNWDEGAPLFGKTVDVTVVSGTDAAYSAPLVWMGPGSATGILQVTFGRVGELTTNSSIPVLSIP